MMVSSCRAWINNFIVRERGFHTFCSIFCLVLVQLQSSCTLAQAEFSSGFYQEEVESHSKESHFNVSCPRNDTCFLQFTASDKNVYKGVEFAEKLFQNYLNENNSFTLASLEKFYKSIGGLKNKTKQSSEGHHDEDDSSDDHDHGEHEGHDHEAHDHGDHEDAEQNSDDRLGFYEYWFLGLPSYGSHEESETKCLTSAADLINEFFPGVEPSDVNITLSDFVLIIPRLLFDLQSTQCQEQATEGETTTKHEHEHHVGESDEKEDSARVWGIALGAVAGISALSVIGVVMVPLMSKSIYFNRVLSFLVALAVGTLVGDALLHLLPHAMGGHHEHGTHAHGSGKDEKDAILKSLVAVMGIYGFFVFESVMTLIRKRAQTKRKLAVQYKKPCPPKSDAIVENVKHCPEVDRLVMEEKFSSKGDGFVGASKDSGISLSNGVGLKFSKDTEACPENGGKIPPFPVDLNLCENGNSEKRACEQNLIESPSTFCHNNDLPSPHNMHHDDHHHHHHEHHHPDLANAQGIKDLAWMIIMGDGLHNFSDGLAIGAAFSSNIAAGLSTSLAIFCHELPHELGDFAILIDAGMTVKKALLYNGLCACLAFLGAIIGLLIGQYSVTVKLWILAITAGGFLYVGLVDMLSEMLRHSTEKDGFLRFFFQNFGFLLGIIIMLLIAWFEDSFMSVFGAVDDH